MGNKLDKWPENGDEYYKYHYEGNIFMDANGDKLDKRPKIEEHSQFDAYQLFSDSIVVVRKEEKYIIENPINRNDPETEAKNTMLHNQIKKSLSHKEPNMVMKKEVPFKMVSLQEQSIDEYANKNTRNSETWATCSFSNNFTFSINTKHSWKLRFYQES
ncbi:hypothetical protein ACH5RR_041023 [Cinchona calisaya]|uniref:Uncharacterized protein n=1 Tax=Cinchona calisaya TaxID=153742 RepID=A0ABD2XST5_9GENT